MKCEPKREDCFCGERVWVDHSTPEDSIVIGGEDYHGEAHIVELAKDQATVEIIDSLAGPWRMTVPYFCLTHWRDTTQGQLEALRVSVARIAQTIQVQTDQLPVLNKEFNELCVLSETKERGWNDLAGLVVDTIQDRQADLDAQRQSTAAASQAAINEIIDKFRIVINIPYSYGSKNYLSAQDCMREILRTHGLY